MKGWHFQYKPLNVDKKGTIDKLMYEQYIVQSFWPSQLEQIVTKPFEGTLKQFEQTDFDFIDFKVRVSIHKKKSVSWKDVYEKLETFIEVESGKYKKGVGYCISIEDVLKEIDKRTCEFTLFSAYPLVIWPRGKKFETPLRDVIVPDIDYHQINKEIAKVSLNVRRFKKSLVEEVIDSYKKANKLWMGIQTGYDKSNIPPKDISPISRVRHIGDLRYITINLVREDNHDYKAIIETIASELKSIKDGKRGKFWKIYRATENESVNLGKLKERLLNLYNNNIQADVRYEITP